MIQTTNIYVVEMRDDPPEAVFDSLAQAQMWAQMNGFSDNDIVGPYALNQPDKELAPWWEAGR